MQNTDSCRSCENGGKTRLVEILGKPVRVKSYVCSPDGIRYPDKEEPIRLQLSVCPTSFCPANCPFCIAGGTQSRRRLDLAALERTMRLLKAEDRVRGIKLTGGEPMLDVVFFDEIVHLLYEVFGYEIEISVSTNGLGLRDLHKVRDLKYIESIHLSRHHYDDGVNKQLFGGADVPSRDELKEIVGSVSFKDIFVLNCLLLRDHVGSPEEAHRFLDFAIDVGIPKVGFVTCSPINAFAKAQHISDKTVIRDDDPALLFTRGFYDYDVCRCRDGVYVSAEGELVEFYTRDTCTGGCGYSRGLVYDADDHLRDGFGGEIIL